MNVNWFPGHMKKAKESIKQNVNLVDLVYEVIDARIPFSSKNPAIDKLIKNKPKLLILNKSDLGSQYGNNKWIEYFNSKEIPAVLVNSISGQGINQVINYSYNLTKDKMKILRKKGEIGRASC